MRENQARSEMGLGIEIGVLGFFAAVMFWRERERERERRRRRRGGGEGGRLVLGCRVIILGVIMPCDVATSYRVVPCHYFVGS